MTFEEAWPVHLSKLPSWFGSSVFAFEGIVLAQYVADDMKLGQNLRPFKVVLSWSYFISWALFLFVGVFGYLAYGEKIKNPFYFNFPLGTPDTITDKVSLVIVLFLTFALQMFPVFSFLDYLLVKQVHAGEDIVSDSSGSDLVDGALELPHHRRGKKIVDIAMRFGMTITLCVLGAALPKIGCITDLVGAVFMSLMGFLLPGVFHLMISKDDLKPSTLVIDGFLILVGVVSMVLGVKSAPTCFAGSE